MTQTLAIPTFREQDFQAPQSRTVGAGVEGLEEITDLERSERLRRMREGTLGSIHSWELVALVGVPDVAVALTSDAILVTRLERAQAVKSVVDMLAEAGRSDLL